MGNDREVNFKLNVLPGDSSAMRRELAQLTVDLNAPAKALKGGGAVDIKKSLGGSLKNALGDVGGASSTLGNLAGGGLGSALSGVAGKAASVVSGLTELAAAAGPAGVAVGVAAAGFGVALAVFEKGKDLAGMANPYVVERYNLAWNDLSATVGRVFVPMVEKATEVVRTVGDFLATVMPSTQEVREALSGLNPAFQEFRSYLADIAPAIKFGLVAGLRMLGDYLKVFGQILKGVMKTLSLINPVAQIGRTINKFRGTDGALASSYGASIHGPASFIGLEALSKTTAQRALGAGSDPQEKTAQNSERSVGILEEIRDRLGINRDNRAVQGFA